MTTEQRGGNPVVRHRFESSINRYCEEDYAAGCVGFEPRYARRRLGKVSRCERVVDITELARRIGRFPQLAHPGSRVKGVSNRGIWTSVASARRHSRRTKETAPLSPRWQSKQPNATTSPDTAFELSRRRQIPPFAAVYTREPSGVRQRSAAATHCGKNAPTASGDDGFSAHLSRLASLSPGLRSRRPFTSRWVCREVGVSLASQSEAL
jgi:hypothetical protein